MIDHKQFIADATRTESVIQEVKMSKERLVALLTLAVACSDVLDLAKKEIFYGKAIDQDKLAGALDYMDASMGILSIQNMPDEVSLTGAKMTRVLHGAIGKFTESGEVIAALLAVLEDGKELDVVNVGEEIADGAWYDAILCDALDLDMEALLARVVAKLKARYPGKFTQEAALNRDLGTERAILEGKLA